MDIGVSKIVGLKITDVTCPGEHIQNLGCIIPLFPDLYSVWRNPEQGFNVSFSPDYCFCITF